MGTRRATTLKRVDHALYEAKAMGRNRVVVAVNPPAETPLAQLANEPTVRVTTVHAVSRTL